MNQKCTVRLSQCDYPAQILDVVTFDQQRFYNCIIVHSFEASRDQLVSTILCKLPEDRVNIEQSRTLNNEQIETLSNSETDITSSMEASAPSLSPSDVDADDFVVRDYFTHVKMKPEPSWVQGWNDALSSWEEEEIYSLCTCDPVTREYSELKNLRFTDLSTFTSSRVSLFKRLEACVANILTDVYDIPYISEIVLEFALSPESAPKIHKAARRTSIRLNPRAPANVWPNDEHCYVQGEDTCGNPLTKYIYIPGSFNHPEPPKCDICGNYFYEK